jgi:Lar family restriction alleviation protein
MTELKPCPFCGGKADVSKRMDEDLWSHDQVEWTECGCIDCGIYFAWPPGAEPDAIAQWNTRAPFPKTEDKAT